VVKNTLITPVYLSTERTVASESNRGTISIPWIDGKRAEVDCTEVRIIDATPGLLEREPISGTSLYLTAPRRTIIEQNESGVMYINRECDLVEVMRGREPCTEYVSRDLRGFDIAHRVDAAPIWAHKLLRNEDGTYLAQMGAMWYHLDENLRAISEGGHALERTDSGIVVYVGAGSHMNSGPSAHALELFPGLRNSELNPEDKKLLPEDPSAEESLDSKLA